MKKTKISFNTDKLVVYEKGGIVVHRYSDIVGIFCSRPYLQIVTVDKRCMLVIHCLKELERLLPSSFAQCSRSAIVNLEHAIQVKTENQNCVVHLKCGRKIDVSRRRKADVLMKYQNQTSFCSKDVIN